MGKEWVTITMTPIAGGYVSSAVAKARRTIPSENDFDDTWEMAGKYGVGMHGIYHNEPIIKARVPVNPIHPGDEFGFEYDAAARPNKMFTTSADICRFGSIVHGATLGIKGDITAVSCTRQDSRSNLWSTTDHRFWLLNEYGVFVPQEELIKEEFQWTNSHGGIPPVKTWDLISDLKVEIIP